MREIRKVVEAGIWFVAVAAIAASAGAMKKDDGGWREGRATFYGDQPELWDINK